MIRAHELRLEEARRAIDNLVRIGVIETADYPSARARARVGDLVTGWLPFMAARAGGDRSWWAPEVGEQVILVAPSGVPELAVILPGAIYQDAHPAPASSETVHRAEYSDGAVIEYDRASHTLTATLPAGGEVDITAPGGVTINGDLVVTGDVTAGGATGVSVLNHVHDGVTSGGAQTNKPVN